MIDASEIQELKSLTWLRENYHHIWFHRQLSAQEKAGFLAACCDSRRCYLGSYSLPERVAVIRVALPEDHHVSEEPHQSNP